MAYGARDKDAAVLTKWSTKVLRETLYETEPPDLRQQTRERVIRRLREEIARRQNAPSYLMTHAREIYGVDPRLLW